MANRGHILKEIVYISIAINQGTSTWIRPRRQTRKSHQMQLATNTYSLPWWGFFNHRSRDTHTNNTCSQAKTTRHDSGSQSLEQNSTISRSLLTSFHTAGPMIRTAWSCVLGPAFTNIAMIFPTYATPILSYRQDDPVGKLPSPSGEEGSTSSPTRIWPSRTGRFYQLGIRTTKTHPTSEACKGANQQ